METESVGSRIIDHSPDPDRSGPAVRHALTSAATNSNLQTTNSKPLSTNFQGSSFISNDYSSWRIRICWLGIRSISYQP